jgi:hypothetical protein
MFDRIFFERDFDDQVRAFAREHKVASPVVELLLDDGSTLYVKSIRLAKEHWLSLTVYDEDAARQIYTLYYSIKRITLHARPPKTDAPRDLRFQPGAAPGA